MYFSKNSGYVLRKAKCLSNSYFFACLKEPQRTLGIKSPIDDPSKPPLRLNVPNDSPQESERGYQESSKLVQKDFQEPRSRSFLSKSKADADANVLPKSEIQSSEFNDDVIGNAQNLDYAAPSEPEKNVQFKDTMQVNFQQKNHISNQYDYKKSDYDPNEGLLTAFDENYYDSNSHKNLENRKYVASNRNEIIEEIKPSKIGKQKRKGGDDSHNSLYIIIDAPEKQESGKIENINMGFPRNPTTKKKFSDDEFSTTKVFPSAVESTSKLSEENTKNNWSNTESNLGSSWKNKNMFGFTQQEDSWKNKDKSKVKFEVHEIDDASTYVFHLKLKRSLTGKPSTVERVPEKEINTRSVPYENGNFDRIRIKSGKGGTTKEVLDVNVDDFAIGPKISEIMIRNRGQGKKDSKESSPKAKSAKTPNKSQGKIKLKRCLTDCPVLSTSKKSTEKWRLKQIQRNSKGDSQKQPTWILEKRTKAEESNYQDDDVKRARSETRTSANEKKAPESETSDISPFKNPESSSYQFLHTWKQANSRGSSNSTGQQSTEESSLQLADLYLPEPQKLFEPSSDTSTNYSEVSKKVQSIQNKNKTLTEANIKTLKFMPGDLTKMSPKVEEHSYPTSGRYDFEKWKEKKEYFTYPLIKRPTEFYGSKTVIPSPEKRVRDNAYYGTPTSSRATTQNYAAPEDKREEELIQNMEESNSGQKIDNTESESNSSPYLLSVNQNWTRKRSQNENREKEKYKLDFNTKKESDFQFSGEQSSERMSNGENEQMTRGSRRDKTGDNKSPLFNADEPPKMKFSSREEDMNKCGKKESDMANFQTSESLVKISSDRPCMKFCAAFPPTLSEVISNRYKGLGLIKRESLFQQTWGRRINFRLKEFERFRRPTKTIDDLSGNSIFFPKVDTPPLDFNYPLFECKKDGILNVLKQENDGKKDEKIADNMANIANEELTENKGKSSVDSLTMMKKVKEIVDLDLKNAVTIFEGREKESGKDASSALTWTGETWKVDLEQLEKQIENGRAADKRRATGEHLGSKYENVKTPNKILDYNKNYQKIDDNQTTQPKCLPGVKEREAEEMKLNSVVEYYPNDDVFKINENDLKFAANKSIETFDKLYAKAVVLLRIKELIQDENNKDKVNIMKNALNRMEDTPTILEMKNGDSILVFDELTQTWTVDYSILEKRQEQKKQEEELARKSELILETFEKIEKENIGSLDRPMPADSASPKIFDYNKAEWKVYEKEKTNPSDTSKKMKQPFKDSNAEEIRKRNSDLYDNLFAVKKEERKINEQRKEAPGLKSSTNTKKESHHYGEMLAKETKEPDSTFNRDSNDVTKDKENDKKKIDQDYANEDENYWETFLKMNVLPFDRPSVSQKEPSTKVNVQKNIEEPNRKKEITPKKEDPKEIPLPSPLVPPPPRVPPPPLVPPTPIVPPAPIVPPTPATTEKKGNDSKSKLSRIFKKYDLTKTDSKNENQSSDRKISKPKANTLPNSDVKTKNILKDDSGANTKPQSKGNDSKSALSTNDTPSSNSEMLKVPSKKADSLVPDTLPPYGKNTKNWSERYVSDNILEISKATAKEKNSKVKSNKVETVKLNITSDKKIPSIITEINLSKKYEEQIKESNVVPKKPGPEELKQLPDAPQKKTEKPFLESKKFYKNFEKYKTPFSDPEYEEKSLKINSDLESNPNLKKLDKWNKTLVLHDVAKPNENIETWLKDESDKMATLLLKVLQEAAEGKPKKKNSHSKTNSTEKNVSSGNPYDDIRKKQESNPENFLFRMRTVNLALESDKKLKSTEEGKTIHLKFLPATKSIPTQSPKNSKSSKTAEGVKIPPSKDSHQLSGIHATPVRDLVKPGSSELIPEKMDYVNDRELYQAKSTAERTEEIPGPEVLKKISSAWKLFPIIGCQLTIFSLLKIFQLVNLGNSFLNSMGREKTRRQVFNKLFSKYGPIVNLQGPLSGNVILIYRPEHISGVFQQDASISVRSIFDSLDLCRRDSDSRVLQTGISTDWSKPEWNNLKMSTSDPLIKGCDRFLGLLEMAGDGLVNKIKSKKNSQNYVSGDFMEDIKKWSVEGFFSVVFEKSFGYLEGTKGQVTWLLESEKLNGLVEEATNCLDKCERGFQLWRLMTTPSSGALSQAYRSLSEILTKQLYQTEVALKSKHDFLKNNNLSFPRELTFMESMLLNDGMTVEEIVCNLIDILIIGTNVTSSALGFLLFNLAQNVRVQNKLLRELREHLPEKSSRLDYNKLHSLKYLRACLKESLRLNMPFPLFFRVLQNDVIISNYKIPKGTYVVMDSRASSMREQVFDSPDKFLPERWLIDERWMHANHPFSSFPFCHGPRTELVKRIVEVQLWSCIAKIVRNFEIEYQFGEIDGTENLISFPNKPLKLNFVERLE